MNKENHQKEISYIDRFEGVREEESNYSLGSFSILNKNSMGELEEQDFINNAN